MVVPGYMLALQSLDTKALLPLEMLTIMAHHAGAERSSCAPIWCSWQHDRGSFVFLAYEARGCYCH